MARIRVSAVFMDRAEIERLGIVVVEEAGNVVVFDADDGELAGLADGGLFICGVSPIESDAVDDDAVPSDVYVIDLAQPLTPDLVNQFDEHGCDLLERMGDESITARVPDEVVGDLTAIGGIRNLRRYSRADTLPPESVPADDSDRQVLFDALVHDGVDSGVVVTWLRDRDVEVVGSSPRKVRFATAAGDPRIGRLAGLSEVRQIEQYIEPTLTNDVARAMIGIDPGAQPMPWPVPWTGVGQTVALADSGIDDSHPDFRGRIRQQFAIGRPADTSDPHGHGTHVAGSIAGDGPHIKGMAPGAELVVQSLLRDDGTIELPLDLGDLLDQAYAAGARIHNNSWGAPANAAYLANALEVDEWVSNHPDTLVVISAGNDGSAAKPTNSPTGFVDLLSLSSPGTAKNALTVGASRTCRGGEPLTWKSYSAARFPDSPIGDELVAGNPDALAAFSGRGPCQGELRMKPDVVAPGTFVLSTRSGTAPPGAYQHSVTPPPAGYAYLHGTSMAAPIVSGLAALIRQYYQEDRGHAEPSAALLKATIVCGARWLTGPDAVAGDSDTPNGHQGFGCVDLTTTLPMIGCPVSPPVLAFVDIESTALAQTGSARRYLVRVRGGTLRVCLSWTDPPGRGVQNCLALTMRDRTGNTWMGNDRPSGQGIRMVDSSNNIQAIRVEDAGQGTYQVQVTGANLLRAPQAFALVVTGDLNSNSALTPQN